MQLHHMKSFIFIVIIAAVNAVPLPTVTVGDFINTPVWYPGALLNVVSAQWSGGAGVLMDQYVPNVVIKNNDGTYRTIVAPFECVGEEDLLYKPRFTTRTNGNIFSCDKTLFELDDNKNNIVNVQNITFSTSYARIMSDNSIVALVRTMNDFGTGRLQTWSKDNSGDWTKKHELTGLGYLATYMTENIVANVLSPTSLQILDRQQDNSYVFRRSYAASLVDYFYEDFRPMVYLNDDTFFTGTSDYWVGLRPFVFADTLPNSVTSSASSPVKLHQYDGGSDSFVFTNAYKSEDLDLKPVGALGTSFLAINNDVVIIVAPYDNYNLTRVLKNGSALVLRRQQDNSWKFETKFVQANPEEAQINSVAGYEDGRLYFVACRTAFAEGKRSRARKECGFKYAEWSPPVSQ